MSNPLDRLLRRSLRGFTPYVPGTTVAEVRRRYGIETFFSYTGKVDLSNRSSMAAR